jgi:hypothetical protein
MSQINVNTVLPFTLDVVDVNGLKLKGDNSNSTVQIGGSFGAITAQSSVIIGYGAAGGVTGTQTVAIGRFAGLSLSSGISNVLIGAAAGQNTSTGIGNTFVGNNAGAANSSGGSNIAVGSSSASLLTTGANNVFIGPNTGNGVGNITGNNNIVLGFAANPSSANVQNEITLGNNTINALRCAQTSITSLSDARDKKDVTDLRAGLDFVKALRPVEFVWDERDEEGRHDIADFGFIAQDLKAAQEDAEMADVLKLVYESNPEKLEASYGKLLPILVKAIQELAAEVEALKA